ncbi:MAG TPA: prolipoprotein diacylglyceryl transferase family protein [Candidatus Limnocylindria bacterium]|nr:prolipoprotein diacylglyceryl transferase family protein [Candidatus Limnocylindria bacterium]
MREAASDVHRERRMLPELHLALPGGLHATIGTHPLVTLLAVLAATAFVARRAPGGGLARVAPLVALVVLGGSRALYRLLDGGSWFGAGGLASVGGVAAGLAAARPLARLAGVPVARLADALVPAALLALGLGRVGCFLAGCCYGLPTALPWGVVFPGTDGLPRHPLQLYSAALDVLIVLAVRPRGPSPGAAAARALAAFAAGRFALETLRDPATTDQLPGVGLTVPQACCVALLLGARRWLIHPGGGLSGPGARGSVARRMRPAALLVLFALVAVAPAAAIEADFIGSLAVRPARGRLDIATGRLTLDVRRWRWVPAPGSDGVDPASEPITLLLGTDEVFLPAGSVGSAGATRYRYRDPTVTRGFTRLVMKRRADGAWQVRFRVTGMDQTQLVNQFALCVPFALAVGNDAGVSGVDLDRPRGAHSPRVKLRGFCEIEGCNPGAIRPRHVICPF